MLALPLAAAAAGAGTAGLLACGAYWPNCPVFGPVTGRGPRRPVVYLTFDDGPNQRATPLILETLDRHQAPASFFIVGDFARRLPRLASEVARHHLVGNHTDTHVKLHRRGPATVRREIGDAHRALTDVTAVAPRAFRAPHGYRNPFVRRVAASFDYRVFGWTYGVWDTTRPGPEEIRRRVRAKLRPGAIVLLHDGDGYDFAGDRSQTAAALGGIITDARNAGYELRSLAELLDP